MSLTCPICQRPVPQPGAGRRDYAPFCSKRCADVDLQRWFSGAYAVPGREAEEGEESPEREAGRGENDPL